MAQSEQYGSLDDLSNSLRVELVEGIPVFRASEQIQERIEDLMFELRETGTLSVEERSELRRYEEADIHYSHLNRLIRNAMTTHKKEKLEGKKDA